MFCKIQSHAESKLLVLAFNTKHMRCNVLHFILPVHYTFLFNVDSNISLYIVRKTLFWQILSNEHTFLRILDFILYSPRFEAYQKWVSSQQQAQIESYLFYGSSRVNSIVKLSIYDFIRIHQSFQCGLRQFKRIEAYQYIPILK